MSKKRKKIADLYQAAFTKYSNKSIAVINRIVRKEMKSRGGVYTHDKFFKEIPTNAIIKDAFTRLK